MLLRHYHGLSTPTAAEEMEDPASAMNKDPKLELQALKASAGGLRLAEKLLSQFLHEHIRIYYYGNKVSVLNLLD